MLHSTIFNRALVSVGSRGAQIAGSFRPVVIPTTGTTTTHQTSSTSLISDTNTDFSSENDNNSSSYNPYGNEDAQALQAAATQLMRFRISKPEQFYFSKGDSICRLCNEFVPSTNVRFHLVGAGPRGPSTHMGREIVLDSLVHYGKLGFDPQQVMRSWAFTLLNHPQYVRLPELLPKNTDPTDLQARASKVRDLLSHLKSLKIIDVSVSPHSERTNGDIAMRLAVKRRVAFERLECIGDNAWGSNLSGRMLLVFPDKRWAHCQMHHSFNTFRDLAETNTNLERMFDLLDLTSLLPPASRAVVGDGKIKADIFEAVLGELHCALYAHESTLWGTSEEYTELNDEHLSRICIIIKHILNEIFDLTLLCLLFLLGEHAVPIARELSMSNYAPPTLSTSSSSAATTAAAHHFTQNLITNPSSVKFNPSFDVGDTVRTRRPHFHKNYVPTFNLPPKLGLTTEHSQQQLLVKSNNNNNRKKKSILKALEKQFGPVVNTTTKRYNPTNWETFLLTDLDKDFVAQNIHNNSHISEHLLLSLEPTSTEVNDDDRRDDDILFLSLSSSSQPPLIIDDQSSADNTKTTAASSSHQLHDDDTFTLFSNQKSNNNNTGKSTVLVTPSMVEPRVLRHLTNKFKILPIKRKKQQHQLSLLPTSSSSSAAISTTTTTTTTTTTPPPADEFASEEEAIINKTYRSLCPFQKLSKYPPHTYNPYFLDNKTWMKRWQQEEDKKEFFDDEVCDNIGVVIAMFEATADLNKNVSSNSNNNNSNNTNIKDQNNNNTNALMLQNNQHHHHYFSSALDRAFDLIRNAPSQCEDDGGSLHLNNNNNNTDSPQYEYIASVREELFQYVHPFRNGVTVGSDGASFGSLGTSITNIENEYNNNHHGSEDSSSSSKLASDEATLDIDEIKRRNALIRGVSK